MPTPNPYMDDSDDDLLGDSPKTREGNARVEFRGPRGEPLPAELNSALASYFKEYGTYEGPSDGDIVPLVMRAISGMYEYFYDITQFRTNGPLLAAVAEVLDQYSDGYLTNVYMLKECERKLCATHTVKRHINLFLTKEVTEDAQEYKVEMLSYFESFGALVDFIQQRAVNQYLYLCETLEREVDTNLVESGYYTERDTFTRVANGNPPALKDAR